MKISVIAAADEKWGIGKFGRLPWHHPEDFKFFKEISAGATCFMGRTTYEEIALLRSGKKVLLPGRECVVFSRSAIDDKRIKVCTDMTTFRKFASDNNFFIGGTSIFDFGLDVADTAYITEIPGDHQCDVMFPAHKLESYTKYEIITLTPTLRVQVYKKD